MPEARATIIVSYKDEVTAGLGKSGQSLSKFGGDLKQGFGGATQALLGFNVATLGTAGLITGVGVAFKYAIDQAAEAERITAQTEAVIRSTGYAAGLTAKQIVDMADQMSHLNAIDDETIQKAENVLLTFKKVGSDIFPQAQQAAIDLSVAFGTDLQSATIQVGKALEDPIRGLTALRRSGVSFTKDQQELIKSLVDTGRAADAQKLILQELNSQFGGSGAAAAATYTGKIQALKIELGNLGEVYGNDLLPGIGKFIDRMTAAAKFTTALKEAQRSGNITWLEANKISAEVELGLKDIGTATAEVESKTRSSAVAMSGWQAVAQNWRGVSADMAAATDDWSNSVLASDEAIAILKAGMDGAIGNEFKNFSDKQSELNGKADEYREKIQKLSEKSYLTPTQRQELQDTKDKLLDVDGALSDNAAAHEEATDRILFSILQQQLATDGLTAKEASVLTTLGERWGIFDSATATATQDIITAVGDAQASGNWDALLGRMDSIQSGLGDTDSAARALATGFGIATDALNHIPNSKTITITTIHNDIYNTSQSGVAAAHGANDYVTAHGGNISGQAAGGAVQANTPYIVGERGPELFVPNQSGNIVPNDQLGGNRPTYILNLYTSSPQVNVEDEFEMMAARAEQN